MTYGRRIRLRAPFGETADRVRHALKEQGFGVLTEIDIRATLREKLGEEMEDYLTLDPQVMVGLTGKDALKPVADEAASRLEAALDSL
jgi:hypothetical protein